MRPTIIVFDDFHPNPVALRAAVLGSDFKDEIGPDGAKYTGISKYEDKALYGLLAKAVRAPIIPRLPVWRLSFQGEMPHNYVHSDGICGAYAAVLYLNTPEQCAKQYSGTAFWRHASTGFESMPPDADIVANGQEVDAFKKWMESQWVQREPWEMSGFVRMAFNRIVIYPTAQFHSRYPFESFGSDRHTGRLIWASFFDIASAADIQQLAGTQP